MDELKEAWHKIYLEYAQLINDGSYNEVFELAKEVQLLSANITLARCIISNLIREYNQEEVKMLNAIGIPVFISKEDVLEDKLKLVMGWVKRWTVDLDIRTRDFELAQNKKTGESSRYSFYESINSMSAHEGYAITDKSINVIQFCKIMKKMEQEYNKSLLKAV